jgi:hypothetical protein
VIGSKEEVGDTWEGVRQAKIGGESRKFEMEV